MRKIKTYLVPATWQTCLVFYQNSSPQKAHKRLELLSLFYMCEDRGSERWGTLLKSTQPSKKTSLRERAWQWMDGRWYILSHLNGLRWLAKWFCTVCYWPWNGHCWFKGLNGIQILRLIRFLAICLMIFAFNDNDSFILIIDMVISNSKMALYVGGKISFFRVERRTFYYKDWRKKWSLNENFLLWMSVKFL